MSSYFTHCIVSSDGSSPRKTYGPSSNGVKSGLLVGIQFFRSSATRTNGNAQAVAFHRSNAHTRLTWSHLLSAGHSYGGRPLGPCTYHPPPPLWMHNPERNSSAFASKTQKAETKKMLTSDVDFFNKPEVLDLIRRDPPGRRGYKWRQSTNDISIDRWKDPLLDRFYDHEAPYKETFAVAMERSPRKYAASFAPEPKRFQSKEEVKLGPGAYDEPPPAIQVIRTPACDGLAEAQCGRHVIRTWLHFSCNLNRCAESTLPIGHILH